MPVKHTRRDFLALTGLAGLAACAPAHAGPDTRQTAGRPPNILLIITDDQGYGDLACHGNPFIQTPNLDRLHDESARLTRFYVSPVCAPTRASLMTGRWNYRTGVVDTYAGRAMMHGDEVTLPEILARAGYRTGIFGKWHLGDNHPMRPQDQGFQEVLVHRGGGIGQPSDPPDNHYFNPRLQHNGVEKPYTGYCTDIFTNAAMDFIATAKDQPFFCYLSTNAPHTPLEIGDEYAEPYREKGLDEDTAKLYGMIANLDENAGRLLGHLDKLGLRDNTVVVFITDNGGQQLRGGTDRFNAGQRDWKGTVYEGGIHVPCFIRWPGRLEAGREIDRIAAHVDLLPTLLACAGTDSPEDVNLDGRSMLPALEGAEPGTDRHLFLQWHRGDAPEPWRACAVVGQRYKLVDGKELYDLLEDPGERQDIAEQHPGIVADLREAYEAWFADVSATRGYNPPRIYVGTDHENPVLLTRQDWRGVPSWGDDAVGHWFIDVRRSGDYAIRVDVPPGRSGTVVLRVGDDEQKTDVDVEAGHSVFDGLALEAGETTVEAWLETERAERSGARYVHITRKTG
jgi:arylsulfatase A-like enzyme